MYFLILSFLVILSSQTANATMDTYSEFEGHFFRIHGTCEDSGSSTPWSRVQKTKDYDLIGPSSPNCPDDIQGKPCSVVPRITLQIFENKKFWLKYTEVALSWPEDSVSNWWDTREVFQTEISGEWKEENGKLIIPGLLEATHYIRTDLCFEGSSSCRNNLKIQFNRVLNMPELVSKSVYTYWHWDKLGPFGDPICEQ